MAGAARVLLIVLVMLAILCMSCTVLGYTPIPREPTGDRPLVSLTGADSKIAQPEYRLIKNEKDWKELWAHHAGLQGDTFEERARL